MDTARVFHPSRSKYLVFTANYLLPLFVCLGVISLYLFVLYSPLFKINSVICVLDFRDCTDPSLIVEINKLKGQNIFILSSSKISSRLTSGDFTIRAAKLTKELPNKITINLQSVFPVVALQTIGDSTWVTLDSKLRVIGTSSSDPNVPTVIINSPIILTIGKVPEDSAIIKSLNIAQRLADELFSIKTISLIDSDTIELSLAGGKKAIFTPKKDEIEQLRVLQAILGDATIAEGIKTIDVRFTQPVLR